MRAWLYFGAAAIVLLWAVLARGAEQCPQGIPSCKVLVLTPDEERALVGQGGVLDTAEKARFLDLSAVVAFFRKRIAEAPAGEVPKPATPPADPIKP